MPTLSARLPKWLSFLSFPDRKAEAIAARNQAKQALLAAIANLKATYPKADNAPITDLDLTEEERADLETLIANLEALTPYPAPLRQGTELLNGTWVLDYSDAQEIARLATLPLGLRTGKICQIIDVETSSFENRAEVRHRWGLLSGYVRVTAVFEPTPDPSRKVRNRRINVDFQTRFFAIQKLLGIPTPFFDPIRTVQVENPPDRIPSLEITYLDETLRIGRGGEGSLFLLTKEQEALTPGEEPNALLAPGNALPAASTPEAAIAPAPEVATPSAETGTTTARKVAPTVAPAKVAPAKAAPAKATPPENPVPTEPATTAPAAAEDTPTASPAPTPAPDSSSDAGSSASVDSTGDPA